MNKEKCEYCKNPDVFIHVELFKDELTPMCIKCYLKHMKYELITYYDYKSIIEQRLLNDQGKIIYRWVIDTREESVKNALIKLGWTPPNSTCTRPHGPNPDSDKQG